jgi:hypothetical protein
VGRFPRLLTEAVDLPTKLNSRMDLSLFGMQLLSSNAFDLFMNILAIFLHKLEPLQSFSSKNKNEEKSKKVPAGVLRIVSKMNRTMTDGKNASPYLLRKHLAIRLLFTLFSRDIPSSLSKIEGKTSFLFFLFLFFFFSFFDLFDLSFRN